MRRAYAIFGFLAFWTGSASAFGLSDFYFESSVMKMRVEIENQDQRYQPLLLRAKSGYMMTFNSAVELQIGGTVEPDDYNSNGEISAHLVAINFRFGAPKTASAGMYFSTGISTTRIAVEQGSFEDYEDSNNLSIGFGLEERIFNLKNTKVTLEVTKFYAENDEDPELAAASLGFRTDF